MQKQSLWSIKKAREMCHEWLSEIGYVYDGKRLVLIIENRAKSNAQRLGWTDVRGAPRDFVYHQIVLSLPVIVKISERRGLDPTEQMRETLLHEYAHFLHNMEIQQEVESAIAIGKITRPYYWNEWMEVRKRPGWGGHGVKWREHARAVGATPRATVRTQINSRGRPAPREVSMSAQPRSALRTDYTMVTPEMCLTCFTFHSLGQKGCEY